METRRFSFVAKINNKIKELSFQVPVENGGVYTNKYCPQDLLTGGISFVTAVNGEILEEFIADCQKQVVAMEAVGQQDTLLDVHIGGLMAVVMDHLARCGRLIFGDLLIYMDVFSLLLEADGLSPDEIRNIYPAWATGKRPAGTAATSLAFWMSSICRTGRGRSWRSFALPSRNRTLGPPWAV